jgi:drug/metabolite transporter (DMT)-like permease
MLREALRTQGVVPIKVPPQGFLVLATLFWAGNFVLGRALVEVLPPFGMNMIRWLIAVCVLLAITLAREGTGFVRPALVRWPSLLVMGVTGVFLFNALVYLALRYTTSTSAALINGATPILTLFVAASLGAGWPTGRRLFGSLVCLAGVAWVVSRGSLETLLGLTPNRGDLIMLVAALCWAVYTVVGGRVSQHLSPLSATTASAALALPLVVLVGVPDLAVQPPRGALAPAVVAGLLYIGLVAAVAAFLAWNAGIARLGPSRGAIFLNLIPVFTAAIAVPALGESLVPAQLFGGLLVLLGVVLVTREAKPAGPPPE